MEQCFLHPETTIVDFTDAERVHLYGLEYSKHPELQFNMW